MLMLGITTATPRGGVALVENARIVGRVTYEGEMHHAERIFGALAELLADAGVDRQALGAVSCDVGPGSFTGIRAGLAVAKGIALGLGLPLLGVGSLEAMAAAAWAEPALPEISEVVCLLDARRGETFFAAYDRSLGLRSGPGHVHTPDLLGALGELGRAAGVGFVGRQASLLCPPLDRARVVDREACSLPEAGWIALLAQGRLDRGGRQPLGDVEPVYLRAPDVGAPGTTAGWRP
jgi:tRNA threonylcarbamoyladenosine biosynthesis protein TsaB